MYKKILIVQLILLLTASFCYTQQQVIQVKKTDSDSLWSDFHKKFGIENNFYLFLNSTTIAVNETGTYETIPYGSVRDFANKISKRTNGKWKYSNFKRRK
jgi:hypothetical protein